MQPPCEIMMDYFLPNIRGAVAHELSQNEESQQDIASCLGITQARVSHYLSNKKERYYSDLAKHFGLDQSELEGYVKILAQDSRRSQVDGIFTLYSIWKNLLYNGSVCVLHQRQSSVPSECSVCMDLQNPGRASGSIGTEKDERADVLHNLSQAISQIEKSPTFSFIIPEVAVNVAMCTSNPKTKRDVAAIPGRITKMRGRARAFVLPEFGSSNHLSSVLLLFHAKMCKSRAVMNIRYDDDIAHSLSSLEVPVIYTRLVNKTGQKNSYGRPLQEAAVLERLAAIDLKQNKKTEIGVPFAIVDEGSEGLEAVTYLFGTNATEITNLAIKISLVYSDLAKPKAG